MTKFSNPENAGGGQPNTNCATCGGDRTGVAREAGATTTGSPYERTAPVSPEEYLAFVDGFPLP